MIQITQKNNILINLSAIIALDSNNGFSKDDNIPWNSKTDMNFFKETTLNNTVIMGYKTLLSLPNSAPLKSRKNIVITKDKQKCINTYGSLKYDNLYFYSFEESLNIIKTTKYDNIQHFFVIGGIQILELFLPFVETIYLTRFKSDYNCDVFFNYTKHIIETKYNKNIILDSHELTIYKLSII